MWCTFIYLHYHVFLFYILFPNFVISVLFKKKVVEFHLYFKVLSKHATWKWHEWQFHSIFMRKYVVICVCMLFMLSNILLLLISIALLTRTITRRRNGKVNILEMDILTWKERKTNVSNVKPSCKNSMTYVARSIIFYI